MLLRLCVDFFVCIDKTINHTKGDRGRKRGNMDYPMVFSRSETADLRELAVPVVVVVLVLACCSLITGLSDKNFLLNRFCISWKSMNFCFFETPATLENSGTSYFSSYFSTIGINAYGDTLAII